MAGVILKKDSGLLLHVHAQPGASKSEISGLHGEALKIRVKAPPVDGKANDSIIEFLAEILGIPKRDITLSSGATGRKKSFLIEGLDLETAKKRLGLA